jgi:transposase InsO family protein
METRLVMLAAAELPGVAVSDLCRELGISRQTFYRLRRRVDAEGPAGLEPRSRRPRRSPGLIPPEVEDEIVRLRKTRPVDNGAQAIAYELARSGGPVLAASTVHRALRRRGLVVDTPAKRPRSSWRRFEFGAPNACWQIDATPWTLRRGRVAYVMDAIDDHSRTSVAARAGTAPTGALAWATILAATAEWGPPARVLSDNGSCFTRRTITGAGPTDFERNLAALGVATINASPAHPQTCGKIERWHQTLKRWLTTQPLAGNLADLQEQLDTFRDYYNHRPHRALHGQTPLQRWNATPPATPTGRPLPATGATPLTITNKTVTHTGKVTIGGHHVAYLSRAWAGHHVTVVRYGQRVAILDGTRLLRRITVQPGRRYEPADPDTPPPR